MEAAGLTIALLPLLISAAENYNNCIGPFLRYKRFSKEAGQFIQLLDVQKVIFRNECEILLENFIEKDVAASMLSNSNHPTWHDPQLHQQLVQLLGESEEACANIINLISGRLREVEQDCRDIVAALNNGEMGKHKKKNRSSWKDCVRTKLRASFRNTRWTEIVNDLRDWNGDFGILASQSLKSGAKQQNHHEKESLNIEQEMAKYTTINEFSRQVYQALGRACTKHTEHLAHTCAAVEHTEGRGSYSCEVRFHMALAGSTRQRQPIRFIVNSTINEPSVDESSASIPQLNFISRDRKHLHRTPLDCSERKFPKHLVYRYSVVQPEPSPPVITINNPFSMNSRMSNDFCDHLRRCQEQSIESSICIGTLESKIGSQHSVFLAALDGGSGDQQAISLFQLISALPKGKNLREFSIPDRIHLAKTLAIAVLQYHASPWLRMSWRSSDVVFFETNAESMLAQTRSALKTPHFSASLKGPEETSMNVPPQTDSKAEARNSLLYSLGIVLLEIAYWKHWDFLKQHSKTPHGNGGRYTDMYQARRLLDSTCSDMGGRYNEIVERLIECEFRCGQDLNMSHLQTAVYRDVICPLEELEEGFRALHVGRKGFD